MQYTDDFLIYYIKQQEYFGEYKDFDVLIENVVYNLNSTNSHVSIVYSYKSKDRCISYHEIYYFDDIDNFIIEQRIDKIKKIKDAIH